MSLIKDIREEISSLEFSKKKLRQFAISIGTVLFLISIWGYFKFTSYPWWILIGLPSLYLIFAGLIIPLTLKNIYHFWMTIAFGIGWFVSRIFLIAIYYLILTPIGLLARIFRKELLDSDFYKKKNSYWIPYDKEKNHNYEKMH